MSRKYKLLHCKESANPVLCLCTADGAPQWDQHCCSHDGTLGQETAPWAFLPRQWLINVLVTAPSFEGSTSQAVSNF